MNHQRLSPGTLSDRIQVWFVATVWCILFGILFTLGGCAPEGDSPKPDPRFSDNFSAELKTLPEPNKYQVHLKWTMNEPPLNWLIHRKDGEQKLDATQVAVVPGSQNEVTDESVEPGKEYTYFLGAVQEPHYTLKGKAKASVPVDLEFKGDSPVRGTLRANRLFLRDGTKLLTLGESISFEVNELLAAYATVDTSPQPPPTVTAGAHGRPCGDVSIKANIASGRLTLLCKAENGANGVDGANGRNGNPGAQGVAGDVDVKPNDQIPVQMDAARRAQLKHWYVTNTLPTRPVDRDGWKLWFFCSRPPGDGAPGESGVNGADGTPGGDGGNTGTIQLEVRGESDFQVKTHLTSGDGGTGGRGGNGGKGAPGGPPGNPDPSGFLCPQAKQGPPGGDGLSGRPGQYGQKRGVRPACLRIGSKVIGDCR